MMLSCWHPRPEDRPSFTELRNTLERSMEKAQSYIDLSVAISEDYYKQDSESRSCPSRANELMMIMMMMIMMMMMMTVNEG